MRQALYVLTVICISTGEALALSVGYEGSSSPFVISYQPNLQPSIEPILQVVNNSDGVGVFSWQLNLEVQPVAGSHGELLFHAIFAPPDSLFGQTPGPLSFLSSPSNTVTAFDVESDPDNLDGEMVPNGSARNILQVTLIASPDAAGAFQLMMHEFDQDNQDNGSSWFPANASDPVAFDNLTGNGFTLLGTININQTFHPGDYDHDGVVGPLDYDRWRAHFGDTVSAPGEDADGNQNSVIDAADYVVWRANLPAAASSSGLDAFENGVPEPGTLILAIVGLASATARPLRLPRLYHCSIRIGVTRKRGCFIL